MTLRYSDKECIEMIKNMSYPVDAPPFVIEEIRKKRMKLERGAQSPEKEMDEHLKKLGATGRAKQE